MVSIMKKLFALACITATTVATLTGCGSSENTNGEVIVYNWGEYIADGSEDCVDLVAKFEEETGIKVIYETYDSNETMYTKLKTGGISVDVIVPSDYMIGRLIAENMLLELNFDNIPNYSAVDEAYKNTAYDPENKYSVPYTWGTVGLIYNYEKLGFDPAVMASPFITTIVDALSLLVYFLFATMLLGI